MAMNPALLEAATAGDHDGVLRLVEEDRGRLTGVTARGNTLLHISARLGNEQIATLVGGLLPGLLAQVNSAGDTALHLAARAGHVLVVSSLVQEESWNLYPGALFMAKNRKGDTALHEAVRNRHALVASGLIRSCPALASVVNDSNESPLYLAAERASTVIVEELLACETANWEGPGGKTALHAAVFRSYDIAEVLLTKKPEFIRKQDSSQSTPLHYAASVGDPQMVQLLLAYDASAAYTPDAEGLSPVHVAAAMGHVAVIQELIQTCPECGELTDNRGRNLLHFAVEKKRPEVVKYVLRTPLLGEIINEGDNDGNTALHLATVNCSREAVLILLADKRVNTNVTNRKGFTPLDMASSCTKSYIGLRMLKIRQALVSAGSQPSPQRLDHLASKERRNREEEAIRCRAIAGNLAIVAVLVATVTFAAAFTLPGGYRNDPGPEQGTAALTRQAAFKVFLISDAVAMVCSIIVVCLLVHTGSWDHDVRLRSISSSMKLMQVALGGMVTAFAAGVYVATARECKWLAIAICVVACGVPLWVLSSPPSLTPFRALRRYVEGKMVYSEKSSKNCGKREGYSNGGSESDESIAIPPLLKILGFERTIDFQTPPLSAENSGPR